MAFALEDVGVDLTAEAAAERLDPVYGREREIGRVLRILSRKTKNNPVLLGDPGVGKTAIVEGLATRMALGEVPAGLAQYRLFSLDLGRLLAGTSYRGDFEQRLRDLVQELREPGALRILFIDEVHLLGKAGRSEGGLDAANLLKPLLARGTLPCIGATTPREWADFVATDPALERRFQPVVVREPSPEQTVSMLATLKCRFESHHGVRIDGAALAAAAEYPRRGGRKLPDCAVDLLDEACALIRLQQTSEVDSPEFAVAEARLAAAENAFQLEEVAHLRFRVLPRLRAEGRGRAVVDAEAVRMAARHRDSEGT